MLFVAFNVQFKRNISWDIDPPPTAMQYSRRYRKPTQLCIIYAQLDAFFILEHLREQGRVERDGANMLCP